MTGVFAVIRKQVEEEYVYLCLNRRDPVLNKYPAGVYELPGGGVDEGEDLDNAIHREICEELGWELDLIDDNGIRQFSSFFKKDADSHYFFLTLNQEGARLEPRLSDEHVGYSWLTMKQIDELGRYEMIALIRDMIGLIDSPEGRLGVDKDFYYELQNGLYVCNYGEKRESQEYIVK